jgi:hypothetical protein
MLAASAMSDFAAPAVMTMGSANRSIPISGKHRLHLA